MPSSRRIVARALLLALFLPLAALPAQSTGASSAAFDALIDASYPRTEPGGVALIARGGRIIYERAFGMANLELEVPMPKDAVFRIASMTKQFTAVAVLQQVERGTLSLQDTVGKFLPTFPAALEGITIEQLLTHTSGVQNPANVGSLRAIGRGWLSGEQIMAAFKDQPLAFRPGTAWQYSNAGYQLLGYILEKVTGEPLPEFIEKTLLQPAGMTHSLWGNDMKVVPNRVSSYLYTRRGIENAVNDNVQIAWAAGALESTAEDFLRWHQAVLSGRFITRETLQKAWTPGRLADGTPTSYGYGWFLGELQGSPIVEHGGNMGGFMSHAMYLPREDLLVAVFLNARGNRLPELLATDLAATAIGRPLNIKAVTLSADLLQSYAGVYQDRNHTPVTITLESGRLTYQKTGGPRWNMTPYARDKVFFDNTSTIGEFRRDAQGRITGFAMQTLRGQDRNELVREPVRE